MSQLKDARRNLVSQPGDLTQVAFGELQPVMVLDPSQGWPPSWDISSVMVPVPAPCNTNYLGFVDTTILTTIRELALCCWPDRCWLLTWGVLHVCGSLSHEHPWESHVDPKCVPMGSVLEPRSSTGGKAGAGCSWEGCDQEGITG